MSNKIHPTAIVHPEAVLGDGTSVGAYSIIGEGVVLGADCEVRSHVVIEGPVTIGDRNTFYSMCVIGGPPQDKKYAGAPTTAVIGDENEFREGCTVNRGTETGGGVTTIGSNNWLMAAAHVAHDCVVGSNIVLANNVMLAGHVVVEDRAIMNGCAGMHHFGTVGAMSYIGALSRLVRDAPPFMVTEGNPARTAKVNAVGLARAGVPEERIRTLQTAFRYLFRRKHATWKQGFEALATDGITSPEIEKLRDFFERMARGRQGRARETARKA